MDPGGRDGGAASSFPGLRYLSRLSCGLAQRYQHLLDTATPHVSRRWTVTGVVALIYAVRVLLLQGFYIVSYALGIYILNLLIAFLSPQVDPEVQELLDSAGPSLPTKSTDEFRPFVRRLPEFKFWSRHDLSMFFYSSNRQSWLVDPFMHGECILIFLTAPAISYQKFSGILWYSLTKSFIIAFVLTFFAVLDVPVFWPILLFYWIVLFYVTMKRQIIHMIKYKYVPFTFGKQRYAGKKAASADEEVPTN